MDERVELNAVGAGDAPAAAAGAPAAPGDAVQAVHAAAERSGRAGAAAALVASCPDELRERLAAAFADSPAGLHEHRHLSLQSTPAFKALQNIQQNIRRYGDSAAKQEKLATARSAYYATQAAHGTAAKRPKQL